MDQFWVVLGYSLLSLGILLVLFRYIILVTIREFHNFKLKRSDNEKRIIATTHSQDIRKLKERDWVWISGILLTLSTALIAALIFDVEVLNDLVTFGATLTSMFLAVIAIFVTLIYSKDSKDLQSQTKDILGRMDEKIKSVDNQVKELREQKLDDFLNRIPESIGAHLRSSQLNVEGIDEDEKQKLIDIVETNLKKEVQSLKNQINISGNKVVREVNISVTISNKDKASEIKSAILGRFEYFRDIIGSPIYDSYSTIIVKGNDGYTFNLIFKLQTNIEPQIIKKMITSNLSQLSMNELLDWEVEVF